MLPWRLHGSIVRSPQHRAVSVVAGGGVQTLEWRS